MVVLPTIKVLRSRYHRYVKLACSADDKSSLAFGRTSAGNHVVFWGKSVENLFNDPCNAKTHLKWIVKNIFPFQLVSVDF